MTGILKNIIEEIALDFLDKTLASRYDVCTCETCVNDMMAHVLSQVPAKYVTSDKDALRTIVEQTKLEKEAEIARAILSAIDIVGHNPRHKLKEDRNQTFQLLLDKIYEDRGLDFRHYHREILKRRVALRMRANDVNSFSDYLMLLIKTPQEYDKLFAVLCINVSEFFRDPDVWDKLKDIFKSVFEAKSRNNDKTLTIWSAACASGEEPYSIALLLKDNFQAELKGFTVTINATDLDPKALRAAHNAEYAKTAVKNVPEKLLNLYFTASDKEMYKLNDEIKKMITFRSLDLISSDFIKDTDIVLCRNVFIYFTRSLQDQLLMKFYKSLRVGGYLILGKTETMWTEAKEIFEDVDVHGRIYRKIQASANLP